MRIPKTVLLISAIAVLAGCSVSGRGSTGPQLTFAEIYSIALTVNNDGEFHLSGEVAIPTPLRSKIVDLDWLLAFDLVFNEAQQATNTLFLLYEDDFGNVIEDVYTLDHAFKVEFARNEWVRKIQYTRDGSAVVFVERFHKRTQIHFVTLEDFEIAGCSSAIQCPDTERPSSLFPEGVDIADGNFHTADIHASSAVLFLKGWCTNDQSLLYQNLEHIEFVFNIDGVSYADHLESQYRSQPGIENEEETEYCYLEGAVIRNWSLGEYDIEFGFRTDTEIYDGWDPYPAQEFMNRLVFTVE